MPQFRAQGALAPTRVRKPLFGQDIYVMPEDFDRYHAGSVAFWTELADALSTLTR
jgi:hypothetical protein